MDNIQTILYLGNQEVGDINKYAKNRHVEEVLMSEQNNGSATTPLMTFDISRKALAEFLARRFDDPVDTFIRVGKLRVVFIVNGFVAFFGYLAKKPQKSGMGDDMTYSLTFFNDFARLSGDLVCATNDETNPYRRFDNRPAHLFVQDLINDFKKHADSRGEVLNWSYGHVDTLANKSIEYSDFQTVSKALCDAMNNTTGAAKFDVVFRLDPNDYTHDIIDILAPRGKEKNIIIQYPADGVYKLFSNTMEFEEESEYASDILSYGTGDLGDKAKGELTAPIATASNNEFVQEYFYYKVAVSSNLKESDNNQQYATKTLAQMNFAKQSPSIKLQGRPISWFNNDNEDNGLGLGDTFTFLDSSNNGSDDSGKFRITALSVDWDDNGVATATPTLQRVN